MEGVQRYFLFKFFSETAPTSCASTNCIKRNWWSYTPLMTLFILKKPLSDSYAFWSKNFAVCLQRSHAIIVNKYQPLKGGQTQFSPAILLIRFSAHTRITNLSMAIQRSFYFAGVRVICAIFLHNWTQCIDGFSNDAKDQAILRGFYFSMREPRIRISQNLHWYELL